jgi:diaminohydroxyphosphoribosylaminopyrimidine deaminase/5-amino-6-(5-phosphoribosylamino)uracil reductase
VKEQMKDERYMRMAIREARNGLGQTSPNPAVGAVLVIDGKVVSRGFHQQPGGPHAEVQCLHTLAKPARKSTLYVTLEPCSTIGKTGRCTDAIIRAGVSTVVVGALDPNPKHNGRGIAVLQRAGIQVRTGVLGAACTNLNEAFNKWIITRTPFVIAKCGMSLDGRLTLPADGGRWITGAASRRDAQQLRAEVDAIMVGAETIRIDNPRLTVRGRKGARQPWRVVLTKSGRLPADSRILTDRFRSKTLVYRNKTLRTILRDLGKKEILSVMIEGGGDVLGQALDSRLIDKIQIYIGPVFTGGSVVAFGGRGAPSTGTAVQLERIAYSTLGQDIRITGYIRPRTHASFE